MGIGSITVLLKSSPPWMRRAFCFVVRANPEIFHEDGNEDTAKAYCDRCVVRDKCLTYAMENGEFGVWGGTTEGERRALKRGGERASCPGCAGIHLYSDGRSEICLSCGISWLT